MLSMKFDVLTVIRVMVFPEASVHEYQVGVLSLFKVPANTADCNGSAQNTKIFFILHSTSRTTLKFITTIKESGLMRYDKYYLKTSRLHFQSPTFTFTVNYYSIPQ